MHHFCIFFTLVFLFSCNKNNPTPAWLDIQEWSLIKNKTNKERDLSHSFTNAYIEIDDETIGFFELPIKLPILKTGKHQIKIFPVVLNNGISASKTIYPFCEPYKVEFELLENKTIKINPVTSYYSDCIYWIEDFEDAGVKIKTDEGYNNILSIANNKNFLKYGNNYAQISLNKDNSFWQGKTTTNSTLPQGKNIYLEVDYLNTVQLLTGVYTNNGSGINYSPNVTLNAQDKNNLKWKKVYIDLRQMVSYSQKGSIFEQYFKITNPNLVDSNFVLLDNIKIIYRP
jgi:hypothetical protein